MSLFRFCLLLLPLLVFLTAATPSPRTTSVSSGEALEHNRELLRKWKTEPEHSARLQRDLHDFWALPEAKRQRLQQLDHALHQLDAKTQKRLWKVAERYSTWLERLPEEQRRQIEATQDTRERVQLIRALRERQWIDSLPRKVQEDLEKLPPEERAAQVVRLREQERQQRILWKRPISAGAHPKQPARLADLPPEVKTFVEKQVLPHLTVAEKQKYHQAEGNWPEFPRTVRELTKRHPVLPPLPPPHKPIVRFEDLPQKAKVEAGSKAAWERREDAWERLRRVEGKWPEWALAFHALLSAPQRQRMPPLGASRPGEFPAEVQTFLSKTLKPKVQPQEWNELRAVEGKWPDYPLHLLRLAEKHALEVPGMSLPGGAEW